MNSCNRMNRKDRKSTRLNSSHIQISYAVFCLKKKKNTHTLLPPRQLPPISRPRRQHPRLPPPTTPTTSDRVLPVAQHLPSFSARTAAPSRPTCTHEWVSSMELYDVAAGPWRTVRE